MKGDSMKMSFDQPLFIFEMANNHMGDLSHGKDTINAFARIADDFDYRFAFKFQFRHIDTFIHPDYQPRTDIKYVKRFKETALAESDFRALRDEALKNHFITICTPFDEPSVGLIEALDIEIIKIASCSFTDWPLLERVVKSNKPIIASTAGATLDDIDKVVSFFQHRDKMFALMHCVGEYPTKAENLQLNQIDLLKQRYANIPVGFSTHESPDNDDAIKIAIAKGATLFERHVALDTPQYPKNNYSSTPEQIRKWMTAADDAYRICGVSNKRTQPSQKELADLRQFKRGMFVKQSVANGENIQKDNLFYAFPNQQGQLLANDMSKYI
jgi:sialic acid synthase SpsE